MGPAGEKVTEDAYFEQPALEWLQHVGWSYIHGSNLAPDAPAQERTHWADVVLAGRLRSAIARLNPELPADAVGQAVERVLTHASPEVIRDHQDFHDYLLRGVSVTYLDGDGVEQSPRAALVDWEVPENNEFLAVNQFIVIEGDKNRRPDILLFVNGLPLGQIEGKNPTLDPAAKSTDSGKENSAAVSAINQVRHYTQTIPRLYRYVEFFAVSDLLETRLGTITTPAEHFAQWKSMDISEDEGRTSLEITIGGAFAPAAFLDMIRNFTVFQADGERTYKVMAKYHQVHAVNAAVESVAAAMQRGDGRGGVVWHTTGVGKSYAMAFFVTKIRRDQERFGNPTVVVVTDRTSLDDQLHGTFASLKNLSPVQAESIDDLHQQLDRPAGGIIFTTIQKFQPPVAQRAEASEVARLARDQGGEAVVERVPMPVLNERRNIIVVTDEAHRSQYQGLAQNLQEALPNATRIGFTGTPIESSDRSTRLVFGDYISVYRMSQAREDEAVVPIFYESRQIPVDADEEELAQVADILEEEEDEARTKLVTAWAKLEKVVGAPDRLDKVATDIADHYHRRCEAVEGKALVVGYSRHICAELTLRLQKLIGEDAVTCVMSAAATDDELLSQFRRNKKETKDLEEVFRKPDSPLKIVVVRDMWLTGYDAPCLHTLYVDKPMRDHGLLQAIARVNRLFRDKAGGLIVDYIGIGEDLRNSLKSYSAEDIDDMAFDIDFAAIRLREKYEVLCDMLHGIHWRPAEGDTPGQKATRLVMSQKQAVDRLLQTDDKTQEYLDTHVAFTRWYSNAATHPDAIAMVGDRGFFDVVAKQLRQLQPKGGEASTTAQQAVKQFFSTGIAAGEVADVFDLIGEERPQISVLSDEFLDRLLDEDGEQTNVRLALVRKLIDDQLRARVRTNNLQAREFADEVSKVLARYRNRQLSTAEVISALVEIAKKIRDTNLRHEEMDLTPEEAAFYDALAGTSGDMTADPELKKIAELLVKSIKQDLSVDWTDRRATEDAIRVKIKRILRREGYTAPPAATANGGAGDDPLEYAVDRVILQAKTLYRYWPDVPDDSGVLFAEQSQYA